MSETIKVLHRVLIEQAQDEDIEPEHPAIAAE
jgi:hypothetical protein